MSIQTAFVPNADKLAQITGTGISVGAISPTFAAAVSLAAIQQYASYIRILGVNATSATCAVTTTYAPPVPGANLQVSCESIAAGTVTYTFGAGFKTSATAAATTLTAMTVEFNWNGTNWIEAGRSLAIAT